VVDSKYTPPVVPATLAVGESVHLAGNLSLLDTGEFQLSSIRGLNNKGYSGKFKIPKNKDSILNIDAARDSEGNVIDIHVAVVGAEGSTLCLDPKNNDDAVKKRCVSLLSENSSHPGRGAKTKGPNDKTSTVNNIELLQKQSIAQLRDPLQKFMDDLSGHLLDLSAISSDLAPGESIHYTALNAIKNNRDNIIRGILETISGYYQELTPSKLSGTYGGHTQEEQEKLELLGLDEFEHSLAVRKMLEVGEGLYGIRMECLIIRLAELAGADPHTLRLPIHINQLCTAFLDSMKGQGIPLTAIIDIIDYFDKGFVRKLDGYYCGLNTLLQDRGVCPDLEEQIQKSGSMLNRAGRIEKSNEIAANRRKRLQSASSSEASVSMRTAKGRVSEIADQVLHKLNSRFSPDSLYRAVTEALNFEREAGESQSYYDSGDQAERERAKVNSARRGKLVDAESVAQILSVIQQDAQLRSSVQKVASVRDYLERNQDQISGLKNKGGLSPETVNQLKLVDNMFGIIRSNLDITAEMKPILSNLQIPLARLALMEPGFFVDHSHKARAVIDKLTQLTTAANFPNPILEGRIQQIVDYVVTNFENDSAVFDSALTEVDKLVAQQSRGLNRNIERVVRTQEGHEKLMMARRAVREALSSRIAPPAAPSVLISLVDNGWRDLLTITYLKEGPDSTAWKDHIGTLDILSKWLKEQGESDKNESIMLERGLEAEPFIDMIEQQITAAMPATVNHEAALNELREILAGRSSVALSKVVPVEPSTTLESSNLRERIKDLPRLRRWIKRVEELETGTWLSYKEKTGKKRRMQLAWVSVDKDRYIFVNERGRKNADLTSVQLARELHRGARPPIPSDKLSMIDRSMFEAFEHVQKTLSFAKNHDKLTKLINRDRFIEQMNLALRHAQNKHSQHAVLWLNIDQFSAVNDTYNREHGDQVLTDFSQMLAELNDRKFSTARLQDDEFAILLADKNIEQALFAAEKIRFDIEASSVTIEGRDVQLTVSVGLAPIYAHSPAVVEVLESARNAMQLAKDQGRNRVVVYEEDKVQEAYFQKNFSLAKTSIIEMVDTDRLALRAQPIKKTLIAGDAPPSQHYELLLALVEPDGELSSPKEFIERAERYGSMTRVDKWVVEEAFRWIKYLKGEQRLIPNISINLSGSSVTNDDFLEFLQQKIIEFDVKTELLCFEITEVGTISNLVSAGDFVRALKNMGCKIAIDDFGTGPESHNYLRELQVDYVKIDGAYILGVSNNRQSYAMVRAINDLAHFLGQETIAEWVEDDETIRVLKKLGVDYLQGWGIGNLKALTDVSGELQKSGTQL